MDVRGALVVGEESDGNNRLYKQYHYKEKSMKRLLVLLCGVLMFSGGIAHALTTPTGFTMTAPTTAKQTVITVAYTLPDSTTRAHCDSITIRNTADSTWVAKFSSKTVIAMNVTGLIPNHAYDWVVSEDSSTVHKVSTHATLTTTALVFTVTQGPNPLTSFNWTLTSFDSTGIAADSLCIVSPVDSTIQKNITQSSGRNPKSGTISGLSPNTTGYRFMIMARTTGATAKYALSNAETVATTWIGMEPAGRSSNMLTTTDEPMRSAESYKSYSIGAIDSTTIILHGADTESTMVYIPWKYTSITALCTSADSILYSIWPYYGKTDSLTGWYVTRDNADSAAVTTATKILPLTIPPTSGFYLVVKGYAGTKKVLPLKLFLNRDRH